MQDEKYCIFVRSTANPKQKSYSIARTDYDEINLGECIEYFNSNCNIDFYEYRKKITDLAKETYSAADIDYFINENDKDFAWKSISEESLEFLNSLPDNYIIIPMDDDDWINPDFKNHVKLTDPVTAFIWYVVVGNNINSYRADDRFVMLEKDKFYFQTCGYGVPVALIKKALKNNSNNSRQRIANLLLKHTRAENNFYALQGKNIQRVQQFLTCHIFHLACLSTLRNKFNPENEWEINEMWFEKPRRPVLIEKNAEWVRPYAQKLKEINSYLTK